MFIIKYRKLFYAITILITVAAVVAVALWGLKPGIDFKGGSLLEVEYPEGRPEAELVQAELAPLSLEETIRPIGDTGYLLRMKELSEGERAEVIAELGAHGKVEVKRFNSIGPTLGNEAARHSIYSIILVLIAIVLFITFTFRKVSKPVSSFKYGLITVTALAHDVIVPMGVFAFLGHFHGVEVDTLFVTALLVVLGFSVHDTIVVFDRVRENLKNNEEHREGKSFDTIVGESIKQTFVRSVNTSLTVLLSLIVLFVVGGEATRYFTLTLLIGVAAGTFSSIFLASPLLVTIQKFQKSE